MQERKFDFDDIIIVPKIITDIKSRNEINPKYKNGKLPLFTAPMSSVVDCNNMHEFDECDINVVLPRTVNTKEYFIDPINEQFPLFRSYGLSEFEEMIDNGNQVEKGEIFDLSFPPINKYVLIDVANGQLKSIGDLVDKAKKKFSYLKIMVGNIANPETYRHYAENTRVDYVRVGIGNGCFIDGTKITTDKGFKNIENIKNGDNVLTHKGEFKKVLDTKKIKYKGELIKINNEVTCTPDHEFYVLNKKYLDIVNDENVDNLCEWVSAMELSKKTEYLLIEHNSSENKYTKNENKIQFKNKQPVY